MVVLVPGSWCYVDIDIDFMQLVTTYSQSIVYGAINLNTFRNSFQISSLGDLRKSRAPNEFKLIPLSFNWPYNYGEQSCNMVTRLVYKVHYDHITLASLKLNISFAYKSVNLFFFHNQLHNYNDYI